ncbi:MAG: hypothetical protein R2710_06350 [Acidimicrobiales bacterium]
MTHYPPFGWNDASMSGLMQMILSDPDIPADAKDPANWPDEMQAEWSDDKGLAAAPLHRAKLIDGLDRVRADLEAFDLTSSSSGVTISTRTSKKTSCRHSRCWPTATERCIRMRPGWSAVPHLLGGRRNRLRRRGQGATRYRQRTHRLTDHRRVRRRLRL